VIAGWNTISIASGSPAALKLLSGTYWLAWQWNSTASGPSYTAGGAGDGNYAAISYGAFPSAWPAGTSSSEKWSIYATYTVPTITSLSSAANPSTYGQAVSFTATVTGAGGTPPGTVQFKTNGVNFGSPVVLSGGTALSEALPGLPIGAHIITAEYSGGGDFSSSASSPLTQTVSDLPPVLISAIRLTGTNVVVEWPGTNAWSYTVECSTALPPFENWSNLCGCVGAPGTNGPMCATDANGIPGPRFYRVRMLR
jgi:hypothetical protein